MTWSKKLIVPAMVVAAIVFGATASPARSGSTSTQQLKSLDHKLAAAINHFRAAHGLRRVAVSPELHAAALEHSLEMGTDGYFDHNSYDGTPFWKRIQSYYTNKGYSYWSVGENLLWADGTLSPKAALKMWINSPEHLKNLLHDTWRNIGISAVYVPSAPGVYGGYDVTIITADFGDRQK